MKIVILGCNSFAGKGLKSVLQQDNHEVHLFSRGETARGDDTITGNVFSLVENQFFDEIYDIVINFIIIKNESIEKNLKFINGLIQFCKRKNVKHLMQISSVSVYPNYLSYVNEKTAIDEDYKNKGSYGAIKIAVDQLLQKESVSEAFKISFLRSGFILENDTKPSLAGIFLPLFRNFGILLGNKKTTLPTINKVSLHKAIAVLCKKELEANVFLITANNINTKYKFVKKHSQNRIVPLPKFFTILGVRILVFLRIFDRTKLYQVKGLFKVSRYDSRITQQKLKLRFK